MTQTGIDSKEFVGVSKTEIDPRFICGKSELVGKLSPIVDRNLTVLAYIADVDLVERGTTPVDYYFRGVDPDTLTKSFEYLRQQQALRSYEKTVPLVLFADKVDPFSESIPRPEGVNIILKLDQEDSVEYWDRIRKIADEGIAFAADARCKNGEVYWLLVNGNHPQYIFMSLSDSFIRKQFLRGLAEDNQQPSSFEKHFIISYFLEAAMSQLRQSGVKFIASGVKTAEEYEMLKNNFDAFNGPWISEQVAAANK